MLTTDISFNNSLSFFIIISTISSTILVYNYIFAKPNFVKDSSELPTILSEENLSIITENTEVIPEIIKNSTISIFKSKNKIIKVKQALIDEKATIIELDNDVDFSLYGELIHGSPINSPIEIPNIPDIPGNGENFFTFIYNFIVYFLSFLF